MAKFKVKSTTYVDGRYKETKRFVNAAGVSVSQGGSLIFRDKEGFTFLILTSYDEVERVGK